MDLFIEDKHGTKYLNIDNVICSILPTGNVLVIKHSTGRTSTVFLPVNIGWNTKAPVTFVEDIV